MAENSKIEWTDHTFNPVIGCQKVSPGCDHCYAESMSNRYGWTTWGPHGARKVTSEANWRKPFQWNRDAARDGKRARVFCASLSDWLDNKWPPGVRQRLATIIEGTPDLDWLLLTKRPENFNKHAPWGRHSIPRNVWLGVTAEDQAHYERRWALIQGIPATVRFISYEPALGPLMPNPDNEHPDWIICGGESGPKARMMDLQWARDLRDQCASAGVAYFFKQTTGKGPIPADLQVRQFPR